ncbi:gamm1 protein [Ceraceosorus bombacis]|uniref:Gamm1 protein n=1 Tax=Ceraceosorus bombacis TaxID=401625 RepID=A0A0P1BGQ4_9BASI|nr:gamm1 protein [Ceraceosorus bombacis]
MSDADAESIGIVTHNGTHHADEALAVALLRSLPQFSSLPLTRTRDASFIDKGTIVVDVGATYEPERQRFDHHQRGFEHTFENGFNTKLSSAGLVWKHYGKAILSQKLFEDVDSDLVDLLWKKLYEDFVEAIDGIDNGIAQYSGQALYKSSTDLSSRVGRLNPRWNEVLPSDAAQKQKEEDQRFEKASALAGGEFWDTLEGLRLAWLPAREIVLRAVEGRKGVEGADSRGRILVFDEYASWKDHLHKLEAHLNIPEAERPLYVIYPDSSSSWRIQAVPVTPTSFESRKALPEKWRGVRDDQLDGLLGFEQDLKGAIFVHASGFIGGHKTRQGALAMARAALDL